MRIATHVYNCIYTVGAEGLIKMSHPTMDNIHEITKMLELHPSNDVFVTHCQRILECRIKLKQMVYDMGQLMDVIRASSSMIAAETRRLKSVGAHLDLLDEYISQVKKK